MKNHNWMIGTIFCIMLGTGALAKWEWMNPLPHGNTIEAIWGVSTDHIYAVGEAGTILHGNGGGWEIVFDERTLWLRDVWASSTDDITAVGQYVAWAGDEGAVVHWDGFSWTQSSPGGYPPSFNSVWGLSKDNIWACGYYFNHNEMELWHWDGVEWSRVTVYESDQPREIWGTASDNIYIAGWKSIYRWDGSEISVDFTPEDGQVASVFGFAEDDIYACGIDNSEDVIWHYSGSDWTPVYTDTSQKMEQIYGSSPQNIYVCGTSVDFLRWDGAEWRKISSEQTGSNLADVWCDDGNNAWFIGSKGFITHYDGTHCTAIREGRMVELYDIWMNTPTDIYVVGTTESYTNQATVMHWNGSEWSYMTGIYEGIPFSSVWGTGADNVYAGGFDYGAFAGVLIRWDGSNWSTVQSGQQVAKFTGIWGSSEDDIYFVGSRSGYFNQIMRWNGMSFSEVYHVDLGPHLEDIMGFSADDIYVTGGGILHWDGDSWDYMPEASGLSFHRLWGTSPDNIYGVARGNDIMHWDGIEWSTVYSENGAGFNDLWGPDPGHLYVVGGGGYAVYRDGADWIRLNTGTLTELDAIEGLSGSEIVACGRYGTVLHCDGVDPTPAPTMSPTPTPTQLPGMGVTLEMPSHFFHPGDPCGLDATLRNDGSPLTQVPFFVILQIADQFWFYPGWTNEVACDFVDLETGVTPLEIIPEFTWPDTGQSTLDGMIFWGAMTDPGITQILGDMDGLGYWMFGFGP